MTTDRPIDIASPGGTARPAAQERPGLPARKRLRLGAEMVLLYLGAPLIIYYFVYVHHIPLFTLLPCVALIFIVFLLFDKDFSWVETLSLRPRLADVARIVSLFLLLGGALALWAWVTFPYRFLFLPRMRPDLWSAILILYPLTSVTTQEIVYRVFYFHRYAALFAARPRLAIVVNAALFSFSHIIFQHWVSMALTFAGGLLFAYRFSTTRTYWTVVLEHSLYGNLIFTVGLGSFFFTGVSGLR